MKWLVLATLALFATVQAADEACFKNAEKACKKDTLEESLLNCNAKCSGYSAHANEVHQFTNQQIQTSMNYLLLASNFGKHDKNRPGLEKLFKDLSDKAWNNAIDLIKQTTKRGGVHNFNAQNIEKIGTVELNEFTALTYALKSEKDLTEQAHDIHRHYSHAYTDNHATKHPGYDAEMAHYMEEKFIEDQADTVRKLSGYTNDLKGLLRESKTPDTSFNLFMFDEYLLKA